MKITKYAHSCLLIEEGNTRILVDPGSWNETPDASNVDALLITHEHQDHFNLAQVVEVFARNPKMRIITHESVGKLLTDAGIAYETIKEGDCIAVNEVSIESVGHAHAVVYGTSPCQNTGYFIAEKLFITGDALHDVPAKPVTVLALPCGGPWMKMSEAIEYAKKLSPKYVFPVHDAMHVESYQRELVPRIVGGNLQSAGIEFRDLPAGASEEF